MSSHTKLSLKTDKRTKKEGPYPSPRRLSKRAEKIYTHPDKTQRPTHKPILPDMVKAYFISNGITNNKKLRTQITRDMHGSPLTRYILNKTGLTREIFETVDWQSNKTAYNTKTENQKFNLCKFIHRWRPTMERLHKIDPRNYPTAICNICKNTIETQNHI